MAKKRNYSDNDKAEALAALDANGGDLKHTSKLLRIPLSTLTDWSKNRGINQQVTDFREDKKKDLAGKLEELAHKCVDLLPEKLPFASVRDLAGALIVAVDKMRLLKGEPTAINQTVTLTDDQRKRLNRVLAKREAPEQQEIEGVQ
ncbi:MAG TPA: hypothetical protein VF507_07355 [Pyrinomonadaceae bacterium]|jgi:hypothetical protein